MQLTWHECKTCAMLRCLLQEVRNEASEEVRRLTATIVEMKRDGFHPASPPDAMPSPDPDLPSQITEAIMARSTRKSDLERELYRYAIRAYDGSNAEDVAGTIWHGGDPQEDE